MKHLTTSLVLVALASGALAAEVPKPGPDDSRVRLITYRRNDVTLIKVQRGTVTRIVLAPEEKIETPVAGFSSRCSNDSDEWCINADKGANQIFVKPKDRATRNNLELHTNLRDYSFEFEVLPDREEEKGKKSAFEKSPFFRVMFEYPSSPDAVRASVVAGLLASIEPPAPNGSNPAPVGSIAPAAQLRLQVPALKNAKYTMQVLAKGEDAAPTLVFDDGRFTYFEFKGTREIPAIFAHSSDDEPTRVNWHMQPPFVVVQRTARKFTLRVGGAVTGVFNEAFDATGIDTPSSTVSPVVVREAKEVVQ